jgi:hypothetical protein
VTNVCIGFIFRDCSCLETRRFRELCHCLGSHENMLTTLNYVIAKKKKLSGVNWAVKHFIVVLIAVNFSFR